MESGLPNIFDQYSVDENRVTNALLQTLASSPSLSRSFLKQFLKLRVRARRADIVISAQKRPKVQGDRNDTARAEKERDTVPDGWIYCEDEGWVVVLESKIYPNSVRPEQLTGHLRGIRSPNKIFLLVLTPDKTRPEPLLTTKFKNVIWHPWAKVHQWAARSKRIHSTQSATGFLTQRLKEFLEMYEDLSDFQGIDFSEGFEPQRAKLLLRSLMDKIESEVHSVYDELTGRRKKISLSVSGVWDYFGVEPDFTSDLHFTVGINIENGTGISLTVPNGAEQRWRQLKNICQDPKLRDEFSDVLGKMRGKLPEFRIRLDQRHFVGRTQGVNDAQLDFSVETFRQGSQKGDTKLYPLWFDALSDAVQNKRGANFQLQFRTRFPYKYEEMKTPVFAEVVVETVKAFKPVYTMLKKDK